MHGTVNINFVLVSQKRVLVRLVVCLSVSVAAPSCRQVSAFRVSQVTVIKRSLLYPVMFGV